MPQTNERPNSQRSAASNRRLLACAVAVILTPGATIHLSMIAGRFALAAPLQRDALEQVNRRLAQVRFNRNLVTEFDVLIRRRIVLRPRRTPCAIGIACGPELRPLSAHSAGQL